MSDNNGRRGGWRKEVGEALYVMEASEREKLSRLWAPPGGAPGAAMEEPRGWLSAQRFGGARGKSNPQDRMLCALAERLEKTMAGPSEWREVEFEGEPVGFDPVVFGQKAERFFYIPRGDALLTPGIKAATPPTRWISCRVARPARAEDLPESLRFDLEAFVALREGRLKIISDAAPGKRLLPNGEPLSRWDQLPGAGACLMAPMEGVECSPMAAQWMSSTLSQMGLGDPGPHWPSLREVSRMAKRWDKANGAPAGGWDEEGPGERFHCTLCPEWEGGERIKGLVTRHPERAIQWAEAFAGRDADIRLSSESGPRLLSRLWRARAPGAYDALTTAPNRMSLQEREAKKPTPAEADVAKGFSPAFDAAWEQWSAHRKAGAAPGAAIGLGGPVNVKRRVMG